MAKRVAVAGATGAVGEVMRQVLLERRFPIASIRFFASERSVGKRLAFGGEEVEVELLRPEAFAGVDIALCSIPQELSREIVPQVVKEGCIVIDNSNAFRLDPGTPLVVPEVNPDKVREHTGIIANPNCSTIQMVVALKPLHDAARITRIVVSTYQAVSGAGHKAVVELREQTRRLLAGEEPRPEVFPYQIAFNVIPQVKQTNAFLPDGYTTEEMRMINETKKILDDPSIRVTATCVRVPVFIGHSESVNVETERKLTVAEARDLLRRAPGVVLVDEPDKQRYPLPVQAAGHDEVFVGRIREDPTVPHGLNLWVVADNLRKGAATNAVQIAELLLKLEK
jgi:aspartate-semialdehyde dehydrogenase